MRREIIWTTTTNQKAQITVELTLEKTIWADGHEITVKDCTLSITGTLDDEIMGYNVKRISHPHIAGCCGKLGIPEQQMVKIENAIKTCESTPEWQFHLKAEKRLEQAEIEEHLLTQQVYKTMEE